MKTGIYTQGREWEPHVPSMFLGIDTEKFHNGITKYANVASNAIESAYDATKQFISKRWYLAALPVALTVGIGVYGLLMTAKPDAEVQEAINKKRKKSHFDYLMKYKEKVGEQVQGVFRGDLNGTLEGKVTEETKK